MCLILGLGPDANQVELLLLLNAELAYTCIRNVYKHGTRVQASLQTCMHTCLYTFAYPFVKHVCTKGPVHRHIRISADHAQTQQTCVHMFMHGSIHVLNELTRVAGDPANQVRLLVQKELGGEQLAAPAAITIDRLAQE